MAWWEWAINVAMWAWFIRDIDALDKGLNIVNFGGGAKLRNLDERLDDLERRVSRAEL